MAARFLLGRDIVGRDFSVDSRDIMVTSYPKSGNTWTRFLVANLISVEAVTFENIERIVPDIYQWDDAKLKTVGHPRILKSHEYLDPRYGKVIYIARDPRDVCVSYYYHHIKFKLIPENYPIDDFVEGFLHGEWDSFGSWRENVGGWLGARQEDSDFLLLRYEDLLGQPLVEMSRVNVFLGLGRSDREIEKAIERSSFKQMKQMESTQADQWRVLSATRKDMPFVRSGSVGGWKQALSQKSVGVMQSHWHEAMLKLGYIES